MVKLAVVLAFLFSVSMLTAREISVTYLVYRSSVTTVQLNSMRGLGYSKNDQPIKITNVVQPANTNYVMVTVTSRTSTENTTLSGHETTGRARRLQSVEIISEYDGRIGGVTTTTQVKDCTTDPRQYVCMPADRDRNWLDVEISSK